MISQSFEVYTDGACSNNQASGMQPGGWGVVFTDGRSFSGGEKKTTNNRMELTAVIEALKNTPPGSLVTIYSDSAYVINAFNQNWIKNWLRNGWKTSQGKPVENQDLWKVLIPLVQDRTVKWVKVKGHAGNHWNELADQLAVKAIAKDDLKKDDLKEDQPITITLSKANYDLLVEKLSQLAEQDPSLKILLNELIRQD
ncbi:ribonuclease H family protein [Tepidibacillus fermentans]|uniref:Ribonuclease H n=1 Tax=Tepidibacillus fermentans TaxID=1281767 RepID=A0A4R3KJ89_9BACI|nr:ribonuclease HI [Tepidibacillus fermentans]